MQVLNLSRPGWELNSVNLLIRRVVEEASPAPAAVVLYSGNNELLHYMLPELREHWWEALDLYRASHHVLQRLQLLLPPPGFDPSYYQQPDWHLVKSEHLRTRVWSLPRGLSDASFWTTVRRLFLSNYQRNLHQLATALRQERVPLVLVVPPVNLYLNPGGIQPQPPTFRAVGPLTYERLAQRLRRAVDRAPADLSGVKALVEEEPSGPIQRYMLALTLDQAGRHQEARQHYIRCRDSMMGLLGAMPSIGQIVREMSRHPGVAVVETRDLYPPDRSIRLRSRELFLDTAHLTPLGNKLVAREAAAVTAGVLKIRR